MQLWLGEEWACIHTYTGRMVFCVNFYLNTFWTPIYFKPSGTKDFQYWARKNAKYLPWTVFCIL